MDASADFSLFAGEQAAVVSQPPRRRWLRWAIGLSIGVHVLLIGGVLLGRLGAGPQQIGVDEGIPESMTVSVISESQLRSLSSNPVNEPPAPSLPDVKPELEPKPQAEAAQKPETKPQPEPERQPPPERTPEEPKPPQPEEQKTAALSPAKAIPRPESAEGYAAKAADAFAASMAQAFKAQEQKSQPARRTTSASSAGRSGHVAGAAHSGKSDEFTRAVIWALGATVPEGLGVRGSTVVTFVVSTSGSPDGLRIIRSSGSRILDQGALFAVRQARLPVPPAGRPADDRTFDIEYVSY